MITTLEDHAIVTDLGSTLGTFVNGVRLGASKSRPRTTLLKAGTHTITLGLADSDVSFTIHVG
jgi:pSer/pThr/pTyr-binding forkhead associated (FHA) protein